MIGCILGLMRQSKKPLHRMAAYWRSKREKKLLLLSFSLLRSAKRGNERKRSFASIYLTRLPVIREEREKKKKGEREQYTLTPFE